MAGMPIVAVLAAGAAALIHLWFFALESVLFSRPTVFRRFGLRSAEDAAIVRFACAWMVGAGIVLYATDRRFLTAAAIQAGPPLLALVSAFVF